MAFQAYPYNGNLRSNEIFSSIYNMIISQQTFADNLKHNYSLVDDFKTDGSMYGDTTDLEAGSLRSRCLQAWLLLRRLALACRRPSLPMSTWFSSVSVP